MNPLLELSRDLHEVRSLSELMDRVVASIAAETRYHRAWLLLPMDGPLGIETIGYALADKTRVDQRMATLDRAADRLLSKLLSTRDTLVIPDLREDTDADQAQVAYFGNRTSINVPMLHVGARIGIFVVGTFAAEGVIVPSAEELTFIEEVAALVSIVAGRLRADAAQRELEAEVQRSQRLTALGRMAGEVAHDFNNLLLAILGNADLALGALDDKLRTREYLEAIRDAAQHAGGLSRQLLTFSRGQPSERKLIRLGTVASGMAGLLRSLLTTRHSLTLEGTELPLTIRGDTSQIEQVLMNLVVNARDAMPEGGPIVVSLARHEQGGAAYAQISVRDRGTGMSEETRARIFEPFFTTKSDGRGTGLGLAVVDSVLKNHDGYVRVESAPGAGSVFRALFPEVAPVVAASPTEEAETSSGGARLLVVDDDPQVRRMLERVLTGAGYGVTTAANGEEALLRIDRGETFALIVTDLMMPGLGGDQLYARVRERPSPPPVLLLTGYVPGGSGQAFEHVLSKPFVPAKLLERVRDILASTSLAQAG